MADPEETQEHPVAAGLVALVGVALVVGLILGLAALAGTRVMGVSDEATTGSTRGGEVSMYLPQPQKTTADSGPEITLGPGQQASGKGEKKPKDKKSEKKQKKTISLSASQTSVSPMEQIDLTGVYPGGEGAILQVQRFEGGKWRDFPVTATVRDQTFSTYVQTGRSGVQRFRVVDTSSDKPSNEVRVAVG
ncbi:hypothetical protein [Nocardioides coralli]|uniref:hypothetical protein n=1 Tax=Nocardioides coralli TaxID=2872154 RepID=UPI001CA41831|nr:hypothetical protein [Nocardioides coralli]QZY28899.1 hypothetical protein K6T13_15855 [Nocardioides coralli]